MILTSVNAVQPLHVSDQRLPDHVDCNEVGVARFGMGLTYSNVLFFLIKFLSP